MPDVEQIADHYFSPDEIKALKWLPPQQKLAGFYACWTRKEAYLKAIGTGLSYRLSDFTVNARPDEPARLISIQGDTQMARRWSYADLCLGPAYCGAIVVEGRINNLVYWRAEQVLGSGAWT
jgi:4'-phosphopantetheinyl transferase